jgi:hypothetical protein
VTHAAHVQPVLPLIEKQGNSWSLLKALPLYRKSIDYSTVNFHCDYIPGSDGEEICRHNDPTGLIAVNPDLALESRPAPPVRAIEFLFIPPVTKPESHTLAPLWQDSSTYCIIVMYGRPPVPC